MISNKRSFNDFSEINDINPISMHLDNNDNDRNLDFPQISNNNYFTSLKKIFKIIFTNQTLTQKNYFNCNLLEKKLLKQILIRKHGLKPTDLVMSEENLKSDNPFSFSTIDKLSKMTSSKRKNEMYEYILKLFIDKEMKEFQIINITPINRQYNEKLYSMKEFFKKKFPSKSETEEDVKTMISTFIKLNGLTNKKLNKYFGKEEIKKYRKNYKFKKIVEYIKEEEEIKHKFIKFFSEDISKETQNVVTISKKKIIDKIDKKISDMRSDFIFKNAKCEDEYLKQFKIDITKNKKFKLPMLILDIYQYSQNLVEIIKSTDKKVKY